MSLPPPSLFEARAEQLVRLVNARGGNLIGRLVSEGLPAFFLPPPSPAPPCLLVFHPTLMLTCSYLRSATPHCRKPPPQGTVASCSAPFCPLRQSGEKFLAVVFQAVGQLLQPTVESSVSPSSPNWKMEDKSAAMEVKQQVEEDWRHQLPFDGHTNPQKQKFILRMTGRKTFSLELQDLL